MFCQCEEKTFHPQVFWSAFISGSLPFYLGVAITNNTGQNIRLFIHVMPGCLSSLECQSAFIFPGSFPTRRQTEIELMKARFTGCQFKLRWCHYSIASSLRSQHLLHDDKLKHKNVYIYCQFKIRKGARHTKSSPKKKIQSSSTDNHDDEKKQGCSIFLNNWSSWGLFKNIKLLPTDPPAQSESPESLRSHIDLKRQYLHPNVGREPSAPTSDGLHTHTCSLTATVRIFAFARWGVATFQISIWDIGVLRAGIAPDKL